MASLWADYKFDSSALDGLRLGGGVRYVDTVVRSSSTTLNLAKTAVVEMPDYWVVDAMASYPVTPYVDVQLNVYNLLDEEYQANISTGTNALAVAQSTDPRVPDRTGSVRRQNNLGGRRTNGNDLSRS